MPLLKPREFVQFDPENIEHVRAMYDLIFRGKLDPRFRFETEVVGRTTVSAPVAAMKTVFKAHMRRMEAQQNLKGQRQVALVKDSTGKPRMFNRANIVEGQGTIN